MKLKSIVIFSLFFVNTTWTQQQSAITVSGFVDAYYSKNINQPASRMNKLRNFDIAENQLSLGLGEIVLQKKAEPVGFRVDADFGESNDVVHGIAPYGATPYSTLTNFQQAYLTAVIPVGTGLTVDMGKFVTHMGYEVIESKDNWNYSRSFMFAYAIPYYHTGVRAVYAVAGNFTTALHIVNGWNSALDNNMWKSLGLMMNYTPTNSTGLILNVMTGSEDAVVSPSLFETGKKNVIDIIVTHQLTESIGLALNADYGEARTNLGLATWKGVAAYLRYAFGSNSAAALRAEIFDDAVGYATGSGVPRLDAKEITGTYEHKFADALLVRCEARYDVSNATIFDKKFDVGTQKDQLTFLVGLVALF
jgi:hypothetical protein